MDNHILEELNVPEKLRPVVLEVEKILIRRIKENNPISYQELVNSIKTIDFKTPRNKEFIRVLELVTKKSFAEHKLFITAIVVTKKPPIQPGNGFFIFVEKTINIKIKNKFMFWINELYRLVTFYRNVQKV